MTPQERLRWGVIGTAGINDRVVPAISRSQHGEVVALASRQLGRAQEHARRLGIPTAYGSYQELLSDPNVDAVYLPLPNFLHLDWVLAAAAAGKHILCEKPMALSRADAEDMVAAARRSGVLLAEAFMYAHHDRYDRLREVLASGEIGEVRSMSGVFTFDATDEPDATAFAGHPGSGAAYDVGCYLLHAARYLLGMEPEAVTAHSQMSPQHGDIDMMTSALVEFPGGISLHLTCGMWAADEDTLRILGSHGRIEVPSAFFCEPGSEGFTVITGSQVRLESLPRADHYTLQADRFAESVLRGTPLKFGAEDPVRGAAALEACVRSLRSRKRETIDTAAPVRSTDFG